MNAEIIAIGTELILGQSVDTNSSWIACEMALMGVDVYAFQAVGDNERRVEAAIKAACERSQLVVTTGGLGPTVDDVTRKAAAKAAQKQLVFHEEIAKKIEERFSRFQPGRTFPKVNVNQAFFPQGASIIPNPNGTAPGFIVKLGKTQVVCLPGVPQEMKSMFEASVKPVIKSLIPSGPIIKSRVYRTTGLSESLLNEKIVDLFEKSTNPTVGVLAHPEGVDIRLTAKAGTEQEADALIDALGKTFTSRLPNNLYGWDKDSLESIVGQMLTTRNLSLAIAESCTGGLIAHRITLVPGSSNYFKAGFVVYSNEAKTEVLSVEGTLIRQKGAVSLDVAKALAEGARKKGKADIGLSTTGIAGPSGGTQDKPVGLVFVGIADDQASQAFEFRFPGNRETIKKRASQAALEILRRRCLQMALTD